MKRLALATIIPMSMMIIAMFMRPLWRDELWALYFSDPNMGLGALMSERMSNDTHPPLYFIIQHFWRGISENILWSKLFSLIILIVGGLIGYRVGRHKKRETQLFFLLCLGSYWLIYFMAEIRPYILLFTLCALAVLLVRRATLSHKDTSLAVLAVGWCVLTCLAALTHYYAAAWMGVLGAGLALHGLYIKSYTRFFTYGLATAIGLVPVCFWIYTNLGTINFGSENKTMMELFSYGFNQFRRGITDKTFGSNLAITLIALMSVKRLYANREASDVIMFVGMCVLTVVVFIIHVFIQPFIKERAFIVIIPALIYLMSRAVLLALDDNAIRPALQKAVIVMTVLSPFLFMSEYFKDREKPDEVVSVFTDNETCATALIAAYYRPSVQGDDFSQFYTRFVLRNTYGVGKTPNLIDISTASSEDIENIIKSNCPIKIIAMNLPRGNKPDHEAFKAVVMKTHMPVHDYELVSIGKNRNILYLNEKTPE